MEGKPITKWCRHYFSKSGCERGQYCTFAHDKSQLGKTYIHREKWSSTHKMVLCRYFAAGQPCKASCAFAHGAAELGTPASKSSENQERPRPSSQTRPANAVSKTIPRAACPDWEAYQFEDGRWRWGWSSWGGWEGTKTQESKTPEQPPPPPGEPADDDLLPSWLRYSEEVEGERPAAGEGADSAAREERNLFIGATKCPAGRNFYFVRRESVRCAATGEAIPPSFWGADSGGRIFSEPGRAWRSWL